MSGRSAEGGPAPRAVAVHLNRLDEWDELRGLEEVLHAAAVATLASSDHPPEGELSITFVGDDELRGLNRRYLGRDRTTDVIAFELGEENRLLGDVYISPAAALRSAASERITLRSELIRLVVHGTLHTLGHDHPEDASRWRSPMFELQERLVRRVSGEEPTAASDTE